MTAPAKRFRARRTRIRTAQAVRARAAQPRVSGERKKLE